MPPVNAPLIETTLPGHKRCRTWAHPEVTSHSLVVLSFEQLLVTPPAGAPAPELVEAVEAMGNPGELLGPGVAAIDFADIRDVKLDLLADALVVEYAARGRDAGRLTIAFAGPEAADACFTRLWRRLGVDFQLKPYKRDAWAAARTPLVFMVAALVMTAALVLTLSAFEDMASDRAAAQRAAAEGVVPIGPPPRSVLERALGWMDWRGVCALGGIAAAATQVWLYRRLTRPPVSLELTRA
jgi:hypothetical protein